jgi:O-antigen/teichoic acid export membrane protein
MSFRVASVMKSYRQRLQGSTFVMNALYLMLSTFVISASGFLFWVVVTRTYMTAEVGLATTLLSVSGLLSLLGLAGFDTTFVRFLPRSQRRNDYINSGFIVVTITGTILAVCVALALPILSPSLSILSSPWPLLAFVFFTVVTSLNTLTNAVFLALKKARYIFGINIIFSAFKVVLPLLIQGDAVTIFVLAGSAQLLGLVLSVEWMRRQFNYRFSPRLHMDTLRDIKKFSFSVYVSSVLNLLPPTILPLIIIHQSGPSNAAYYYMAFTLAGILYTIAYAVMQSAFAESSHDEATLGAHIAHAAKLIGVLLVPSAILVALLSSFLLSSFGEEYAGEANTLLRLFALGALPVAIYSAMGAIFKVTKNLGGMTGMNVVYAVSILGLSSWLIPQWGLVAVGWAWIIGNVAACGIGALFLMRVKKTSK